VEEAALRQISPLIHILRLSSGNIGAKGNTSCVWQHSKLAHILPNLPKDCSYIVLKRGAAAANTLRATKFRRDKIQKMLTLLKDTGHEAWSHITISHDNLNQWPEAGDLCDIVTNVVVEEVDDESDILGETNDAGAGIGAESNIGTLIDRDGDDIGPAPLQNDVIQSETYEGVLPLNARTESAAGNANILAAEVVNVVQSIRGDGAGANPNANANPNLPQAQFNANQTTATFQHNDVLPIDGFADMNTTRYAWARAFPSLFVPVYAFNHNTSQMEWMIFHDITGWVATRDKSVNKIQWYEFLLWRSDGRPAGHPTFSLVLNNHKVKNYLQGQGQYLVNTSDLDPTTTINAIRTATDEDTVRKLTEKLLEKAHVHSGNQPGTPAYMKSTFHEFEALTFYKQYILRLDLDVFLTGSLAEFHEYYLRLLLAKYVAQLSPPPPDIDADSILSNDDSFSFAVQTYKHVVTHYLASKEEIWSAFMYGPVYGLTGGVLVNEFAKSRGAIHYHMVGQMNSECLNEVAAALKEFSLAISNAMDALHAFIDTRYHGNDDDSPARCFSGESLKVREQFCKNVDGGDVAWNEYTDAVESARNICSRDVARALESHFGVHAMHTGNPPQDLLKPGGNALPDSNYRVTEDEMQSSKDVRERRELKQPKFKRERDLKERSANFCNHCGSHTCSGYCWKATPRVRPYNQQTDLDVPAEKRFFRTVDGEQREFVRYKDLNCRMHFGAKLKFDASGEGNLTGGKPRSVKPELVHDDNGLPKFTAVRNHPRILQEPYGFNWYNANNDFQFMLKCKCGYDLIAEHGILWYENYANNLVAAGWAGLEHFFGNHIVRRYLTSYQCKGNANSHDFAKTVQDLIERYCSNEANQDKTIRSLMAVCMSEITKGSSVPRDLAEYVLSSGKLKRSSHGSTSKCSVTNVKLSDIAGAVTTVIDGDDVVFDEEGDGSIDTSFTWSNITSRYKKRPDEYEGLNLYRYVVYHWKSGDTMTIPQFFGYPGRCSWPLREDYSQWMLTFFKPWRNDINELKGGHSTFSAALEEYYLDTDFPDTIRSEIWCHKRKQKPINPDESGLDGDGDLPTPSDETNRHITANDEADHAAQIAEAAAGDAGVVDEEEDADLDDTLFRSLRSGVPDYYDWSNHYDAAKVNSLNEHSKKYYADKNSAIINNANDEPLELFDPEVHKPENAKTEAQKDIIFHHLYSHYMLKKFEMDTQAAQHEPGPMQPIPRPPCQHVLVEGLPGTGKTFIILTLRNITRQIYKNNLSDMASAPTGCAAALIYGSTICRNYSIPTGKAYHKPPSDRPVTNALEHLAAQRRFSSVITSIIDEDSMMGFGDFAWEKHRNEENRRATTVLNDEGTTIPQVDAPVLLPPEVYNRPHGGIPIIYKFGDQNQLPPVAKQPVYSTKTPRSGTSDAVGKIAFSDFVNPPNDADVESYTFYMDEVLRQSDTEFKDLLDNMRNGSMRDEDIDLLLGRLISKLPADEKRNFEEGSLHLVPTWKQASEIIFKYLQDEMEAPIAKLTSQFSSIRTDGKNCCVKECKYPKQNALCVGAKVMLLKNFVVEQGLMNGAVGVVEHLCYKHRNGPYPNNDELHGEDEYDRNLQYAIVNFPDSTIREESKLLPNLPSTCVPVPIVEEMCEKKCCSVRALPLRCCKALSIHKCQGMTVGPGKPFKNVTVHYPTKNSGAHSTPGLELVATSRAEKLEYLAVGNVEADLSRQLFGSIGTTKAYETRKAYLQQVKTRATESVNRIREKIALLDVNPEKSFEGGCEFLLNWYNEIIGDRN
jgi:hypothetical protein